MQFENAREMIQLHVSKFGDPEVEEYEHFTNTGDLNQLARHNPTLMADLKSKIGRPIADEISSDDLMDKSGMIGLWQHPYSKPAAQRRHGSLSPL